MVDPAFVLTMARYNAWQNENLMAAAAGLTDEARRLDRGAFFKSIHGTFNHILWADEVWLSRLLGTEKPTVGGRGSAAYIEGWDPFCARRRQRDRAILDWAQGVQPDWLRGTLIWYSGAAGREMGRPRAFVIAHLFNHQTHHRGQIHAMLTAAGAKPDDTDLFLVDEAR
ncbi:DinB family protein [Bosea minatitlanensis]|uniref:DinB family protein n=1 Tax=Bosea minatitlanensis TaxID=128782 RepID=A0ABW0F7J5_9HYPH|nr:DinB family protein [Bosea minatitlanensis]MCT4493084.1 DinB family protein [Bosea minatitlanensis]